MKSTENGSKPWQSFWQIAVTGDMLLYVASQLLVEEAEIFEFSPHLWPDYVIQCQILRSYAVLCIRIIEKVATNLGLPLHFTNAFNFFAFSVTIKARLEESINFN